MIFNALFRKIFEPAEETPKYDLQMNYLKQVKKLTVDNKLMHYRWLTDHIAKNGENEWWFNGATIYEYTLNFKTKAWWQ